MTDQPVLYKYIGAPPRELSDAEREQGVPEPPVGAHHPGVPLRDLTAADVEALPGHLIATLDASDLYEATGARRHTIIKRERSAQAERPPVEPPSAAPAAKPAQKADKEPSGSQ